MTPVCTGCVRPDRRRNIVAGVVGIDRLAEDLAVDFDGRVGRDHQGVGDDNGGDFVERKRST